MSQGIGGALSPTIAGAIVVAAGYHAAMFALTGIAVVALLLLVSGVPETKPPSGDPPRRADDELPEKIPVA